MLFYLITSGMILMLVNNSVCSPSCSSLGRMSSMQENAGTRRYWEVIRGGHVYNENKEKIESLDRNSVNASLYSRQLLVYGESAQVKLQNSHLVMQGSGLIAAEAIKNLALAGIGSITLLRSNQPRIVEEEEEENFDRSNTAGEMNKSTAAIYPGCWYDGCSDVDAFASFIGDLNSRTKVHVSTVHEFMSSFRSSQAVVILSAGGSLRSASKLNGLIRGASNNYNDSNIKFVATGSIGRLGFVFNDFQSNSSVFNSSNNPPALTQGKGTDKERKDGDDPPMMENENNSNHAANADTNLVIINHKSMHAQLNSPVFTPCNDCLPAGQSRANSLCWLAAYKLLSKLRVQIVSSETKQPVSRHSRDGSLLKCNDIRDFRRLVVKELNKMGISNVQSLFSRKEVERIAAQTEKEARVLSMKKNKSQQIKVRGDLSEALIGSKVDAIYHHYRQEQSSALAAAATTTTITECPNTAAVLGAVAAQEVIKAITGDNSPINQFFMYNGHTTIRSSSTSGGSGSSSSSSTIQTIEKAKRRRKSSQSSNNSNSRQINVDALASEAESANTALSSSSAAAAAAAAATTKYGGATAARLAALRVVVVGAGAIGCEVLKNLALLGVGTGDGAAVGNKNNNNNSSSSSSMDARNGGANNIWKVHGLQNGGIFVVDMDDIAPSNLNRQFLFRERHIGMHKATVAVSEVLRINSAVKAHGIIQKLGNVENKHEDNNGNYNTSACSGNSFNAAFWRSADVVIMGLDNVEARRYVDKQCVKYGNFLLVDAGTQGLQGSVQVVVPHLTESYSFTMDPNDNDNAVPVCTIKQFPYEREHCILWAKDWFHQEFTENVRNIVEYSNTEYSEKLQKQQYLQQQHQDQHKDHHKNHHIQEEKEKAYIERYFPPTVESAVRWATDNANRLYYDIARELLAEHPLDEVDEDGSPFWGSTRRVPRPLKYSSSSSSSSSRNRNRNIGTTSNSSNSSNSSSSITATTTSIEENDLLHSFIRQSAVMWLQTWGSLANENNNTITNSVSILKTCTNVPVNRKALFQFVDEALNNTMKNTDLLSGTSEGDQIYKATGTTVMNNSSRDNNIIISSNTINNNNFTVNVQEFDKDGDEDLGHVSLLTTAANLRAVVFGIVQLPTPPRQPTHDYNNNMVHENHDYSNIALDSTSHTLHRGGTDAASVSLSTKETAGGAVADRAEITVLQAQKIAGNIIPAVCTTTSVVAGLACAEVLKYVEALVAFLNTRTASPTAAASAAAPTAVEKARLKKRRRRLFGLTPGSSLLHLRRSRLRRDCYFNKNKNNNGNVPNHDINEKNNCDVISAAAAAANDIARNVDFRSAFVHLGDASYSYVEPVKAHEISLFSDIPTDGGSGNDSGIEDRREKVTFTQWDVLELYRQQQPKGMKQNRAHNQNLPGAIPATTTVNYNNNRRNRKKTFQNKNKNIVISSESDDEDDDSSTAACCCSVPVEDCTVGDICYHYERYFGVKVQSISVGEETLLYLAGLDDEHRHENIWARTGTGTEVEAGAVVGDDDDDVGSLCDSGSGSGELKTVWQRLQSILSAEEQRHILDDGFVDLTIQAELRKNNNNNNNNDQSADSYSTAFTATAAAAAVTSSSSSTAAASNNTRRSSYEMTPVAGAVENQYEEEEEEEGVFVPLPPLRLYCSNRHSSLSQR